MFLFQPSDDLDLSSGSVKNDSELLNIYTKNIQNVCTHAYHSIIGHCVTLGVDPETKWGSYVFIATIKPSGSAVRSSQK